MLPGYPCTCGAREASQALAEALTALTLVRRMLSDGTITKRRRYEMAGLIDRAIENVWQEKGG